MVYATAHDYTKYLKGRAPAVPPAEFCYWADRASGHMDSLTFNRLTLSGVKQRYRIQLAACACELAELLYKEESPDAAPVVASETTGPHSVSYLHSADKTAPMEQRIRAVCLRRLGDTGLMYRGTRP